MGSGLPGKANERIVKNDAMRLVEDTELVIFIRRCAATAETEAAMETETAFSRSFRRNVNSTR